MLTNSHDWPQEGNFLDEQGNVIKPENVEDYNRHMPYVDKGDRMANSYSVNCRIWKWMKMWKIITITCLMRIRVTKWLTVTQLAVGYGSG
jgi:hypothetical protein